MSNIHMSRFAAAVALAGAVLLPAAPALATPFPSGPANETEPSLGMFSIDVASGFQLTVQGLVDGGYLPGFTYNAGTGVLYSPVLSDPNTYLGTSATYQTGPTQPTSVTIGTGAPEVTVNPATVATTSPFSTPANGTDVVSTQIQNFDLTNGTTSVKAGSGATYAADPSYGQVQSKTQPTISSSNDFPAQSFFDVFVEIDLPNGAILMNPLAHPLIVENLDLTGPSLPGQVVYIHGSTRPVPIYFAVGGFAGDELGTLELAGHGVDFADTPQDISLFKHEFVEEEAKNGTPLGGPDLGGFGIPEPGSLVLLGSALLGFGVVRRRARR